MTVSLHLSVGNIRVFFIAVKFQIYHIRSESNCNAELAVQVEPSSSSGIDMPTDDKASPPRCVNSFALNKYTAQLYTISSPTGVYVALWPPRCAALNARVRQRQPRLRTTTRTPWKTHWDASTVASIPPSIRRAHRFSIPAACRPRIDVSSK